MKIDSRVCRDIADVWAALDACEDRGIHIYDDHAMRMAYRSYAQYARDAGRLASVLVGHGIRKGDKVLLCAETNPDFPTLWLALLWLGATPVPMPPSYALMGQYTFAERIRGILRHFRHYYCHPDEVETLRGIAREEGVDVRIETMVDVHAAAAQGVDAAPPPRAQLVADDLAFIQFTSGSTKAPKGIQIRYSNLFANIAAIWNGIGIDRHAHRWISWLPLYHDMGLVAKFLGPVLSQTSLVLVSPQYFARRPLQFLAIADEYDCHLCSMPNFGYEWILKRLKSTRSAQLSMHRFRWLGVGAEPVNPQAMAEFQETMAAYGLAPGVVSPCYGLAEATLAATLEKIGDGFALSERDGDTRVTCGKPVEGMDIKLVDGRILIRGESVARSALIDGVETPLVDAEGFYDTRDLGYFENGRLVVMGRADEMFIVNGENYFPYDIESAARDVDGVLKRRAICFQIPASAGEPARIVLLYETLPVDAAQADAVDADVEAAILRHTGLNADVVMGVPARTIPVTPSGKLQRLRARQLFRDGYYQRATVGVGETSLEGCAA